MIILKFRIKSNSWQKEKKEDCELTHVRFSNARLKFGLWSKSPQKLP